MVTFSSTKILAARNWIHIFQNIAPQLDDAIANAPRHVPCPVHGGKDGFRLFEDFNDTGGGICNTCGCFSDGFALLSWLNEEKIGVVLSQVASLLSKDDFILKVAKNKKVSNKINPHQELIWQRKFDAIVGQLIPILDSKAIPAQKYLCSRSIYQELMEISQDLLFHPRLAYFNDGKFIDSIPAIVALIRNVNGEIVSIHRTYLNEDGEKYDADNAKKLYPGKNKGAITGASIQLYPPSNRLALAEGIETALALHLHLDMPAWSCLNAGGLKRVIIPTGVKEILIGADNDENQVGQKAALNLAERLVREDPERDVRIITPPEIGTDWLDVYRQMEGLQ